MFKKKKEVKVGGKNNLKPSFREISRKGKSLPLRYDIILTDYQGGIELRKYRFAFTFFYEGKYTVNQKSQNNN